MINKCVVCQIEFESKKSAKTCSPKCRVTLSRFGVTKDPNVTLAEPRVTHDVTFKFYTVAKGRKPLVGQTKEADQKSEIRTAKYWYDVPLGAIPVYQKGWPKMPDYMDGRQYFLWWKNNFEEKATGPVIHNPYPKYDNVTYVPAGEQSRRWGA